MCDTEKGCLTSHQTNSTDHYYGEHFQCESHPAPSSLTTAMGPNCPILTDHCTGATWPCCRFLSWILYLTCRNQDLVVFLLCEIDVMFCIVLDPVLNCTCYWALTGSSA